MLIRLSVGNKAGIEIFSYEPDKKSIFTNPQLVSGFLQAIQSFSEVIGSPLKGIQFFNMILYFKTYGDFSLRLLVSTPLVEPLLNDYFNELSKVTLESLSYSNLEDGEPITSESYYSAVVSILSSLTDGNEPIQSLRDTKEPIQYKPYVKIALVGLAMVGKTSIKKSFFEQKSHEDILPTIRIERNSYFQHMIDQSIDIIDLGGQETYIEQYIHDVNIWIDISSIIFVVDLSQPENFEKAKNYLKSVWKIVKDVNKSRVPLSIFFHKYDPELRNELNNNIQTGLLAFKDFINVASFYLTSVKDNSSHVSLVKSMYFSLPNFIIKHLLEESFIDSFEDRLLKSIPILPESALTEEILSNLYKKGKNLGVMLSLEFQESWIKVVTNEWNPKPRASTRVELTQQNTKFNIKVRNWTNLGISYLCTNQVLTGIIEGLLSSFYLSKPKIIETNDNYTRWLIKI